jgi:beta-lactamase regulating signal transducer with metallopeptidase domain
VLENIFLSVLNMSLTATVIAILIMSVRLIVKNKMPKIFSYALWSIILVRLLVPFILEQYSVYLTCSLILQPLQ